MGQVLGGSELKPADRFFGLLGWAVAAFVLLALVVVLANATLPVSKHERARLDNLTAADVAATYVSSRRDPVRRYLCSPLWDAEGTDFEQVLGLRDLEAVDMGDYPVGKPYRDWSEQRLVEVSWTSRWRNQVGEPAGPQQIFVLVGRKSAATPWKVLSLGTMF